MNMKYEAIASIFFGLVCIIGWLLLPLWNWMIEGLMNNPLIYMILCFFVYCWYLFQLEKLY